jgi:hypothetical protein
MAILAEERSGDGVDSPEMLFPQAKRRRRRRWIAALGAASIAVIGLAIGAAVVLHGTSGTGNSNSTPGTSVGGLDAGSGTVVGVVYPEEGVNMGFGAQLWFTNASGKRIAVSVPADSGFRVRLPVGSYTVSARGHWVIVPQGVAQCSTSAPVQVGRDTTTQVRVGCIGRRAT